MRVLHFRREFSVLSETFLHDIVREVSRQGGDSHVLTGTRHNAAQRPFEAVTLAPPMPRWHPRRAARRLARRWTGAVRDADEWPEYRAGLAEAVRRLRPTVLHAHFGPEGAIAAPVATAAGVPLVVTFYGVDISRAPRDPRWRRAYERLWPMTAAVTVLSEEMRGAALRLGCPPEKLHVVHLGKELAEYPFTRRDAPVRTFVSVGRLTEKKGFLDAIRAVEWAAARGADVCLRIIGEGPQRRTLERYVRERGLGSRVALLGPRPHDQVVAEMSRADAFILCSRTAANGDREGTPTVLLEAQALGLPCVSTRHAGIPEIIPAGNHWLLAEEGDVEGLGAAVARLAACTTSELEAVTRAGRAHVEAEHALRRTVARLLSIYRSVAAAPAPPIHDHAPERPGAHVSIGHRHDV